MDPSCGDSALAMKGPLRSHGVQKNGLPQIHFSEGTPKGMLKLSHLYSFLSDEHSFQAQHDTFVEPNASTT